MRPTTISLSLLTLSGTIFGLPGAKPATNIAEGDTSSLEARDVVVPGVKLKDFRVSISRGFDATTGCTIAITLSDDDGEVDTIPSTCRAFNEGTWVGSTIRSNRRYKVYCDQFGGGPNGLNECGVRRHVCAVFGNTAERCTTVELGQTTPSPCLSDKRDVLGKRQSVPGTCVTMKGLNMPLNWYRPS